MSSEIAAEPTSGTVSRRRVLQVAGISGAAVGSGILTTQPAHAATPNSFFLGGEGSTKAFARTSMPAVSGDFQLSFDYLYPAGPMTNFCLFASFNGAYRGPQIGQTGDKILITVKGQTFTMDQPLTADEWHRFVLVFSSAGTVTTFVDGTRLTDGDVFALPTEAGLSMNYFGYLGDLSNADYNGSAYYDNLEVRKGTQVTFSQNFDDGVPVAWDQMIVGGAATVGLADPPRDAEVATLADAVFADVDLVLDSSQVVQVAGRAANGRGVLLEAAAVKLTADPAFLTVTDQGFGHFAVKPIKAGTTTVTAVVTQGSFTKTITKEFTIKTAQDLRSVELSTPLSTIFVGDPIWVKPTVHRYDDGTIDPAKVSWTWATEPATVATVDAAGVVTAVAPGDVTVTATGQLNGITGEATLKLTVAELTTAKSRASYWTTEKRAIFAENAAKYQWAADLRTGSSANADGVLARDYQKLWSMMTFQTIPRSYALTSDEGKGCINCGPAANTFGQYPYTSDVWNLPWKVTCPNCKFNFPTNDFAAYYEGGLDANGFFDPLIARRHNEDLIAAGGKGNLVNILYPDKGETWGVDDGVGYRLETGPRYTPVAYYAHWKLWAGGEIQKAITTLRDAYVYTGKKEYGEAGIALLDRIADIYPHLNLDQWRYPDGYLNSNGNNSKGKSVGSIWETGIARDFVVAYDSFYPLLADDAADPISAEVLQFLNNSSKMMDKTNRARIRRNIEDGILREVFEAVKRSEIRGNTGTTQSALSSAAVVIDHLPETKEWLDFIWRTGISNDVETTGCNVGTLFVNLIDRDGSGTEGSPFYNSGWVGSFLNVADMLDGYSLAGLGNYDMYANPKFRNMFDAIYPLTMLQMYTPTIGDTSATGNPSLLIPGTAMLQGFLKFKDPIYGQILYYQNGSRTTGLRAGAFVKDPEAIAADVQKVIDEHGEWNQASTMMTGSGFSALREGGLPAVKPVQGVQAVFSDLTVVESDRATVYYANNATLQFEANTVGDSITFAFNATDAIAARLTLSIWMFTGYGIYEVKVDDKVINSAVDFSGTGIGTRDIGDVDIAAGAHTITFTLVNAGKGLKCGLRSMSIAEARTEPIDYGTQRGSWMYFGRNIGHGHFDTLNIDYCAWGLDLLPDMGYPRYANWIDMHRKSLLRNTVAHNTVVVSDRAQDAVVVGTPFLYDPGAGVKVTEVEGKAYSVATRYRRALVQIAIDDANSYLVDIFRTKGGTNHLYSFHAMEASNVTTDGVILTPQQANGAYVGTYKDASTNYNIERDDPTGYTYFFNVDRKNEATGDFSVTWEKIKDTWNVGQMGVGAATDVNVRLTMLGQHGSIALADCAPPENKPGNPKLLRYALVRAAMKNGGSVFTGVIEPHRGARLVQSIVAVPVTTTAGAAVDEQDARAVKVTLVNGRTDLIVHAINPAASYVVDGRTFRGQLGVVSTAADGKVSAVTVGGGTAGGTIFGELDALTGTVTNFTKELAAESTITVAMTAEQSSQVTPESLVGRMIYCDNDGVRNGVFRIDAVKSWSATSAVLSLGIISPIRQYVDPNDFSKGYVYDLAAAKPFRIPLRHDVPTDPAARMTTLFSTVNTRSGPLSVFPKLVQRVVDQQKAGNISAARSIVVEMIAKLQTADVKKALSPALYAWIWETAQGWEKLLKA